MRATISALFLGATLAVRAQINMTEVGLDNGVLHMKADLTRGGAICYLSKSGDKRNIVNIGDEGRYIQQSYYAGHALNRQAEGQDPNWSPWTWNPIQVGDVYRNRAQISDYSITGDTLYVKCIPMLWDMDNRPAEAIMEQWTIMQGNVLHVWNRLTCQRTDSIYGDSILNDQELPAVYVISALRNLYSYFGDQPFTHQPVDHPCVTNLSSGFWGRYGMVSEHWMAFTDDDLWGIGVYNPRCSNFLAGMSGVTGQEANSSSTGYIAPVKKEALGKNSIYEYDYYLIVGTLNQIRDEIYMIHAGEPIEMPAEEKIIADVWPNPATDIVNLKGTCICKGAAIELFNAQGQGVYTAKVDVRSIYQLDVSSFTKGIYVIKLSDGENVIEKKLIIN
jgi:hypothetical protein